MPLFGLIKNKKKKTKDQNPTQSTTGQQDGSSVHAGNNSITTTNTAATAATSSSSTTAVADPTKVSSINSSNSTSKKDKDKDAKKLNKVKSDTSSLQPVRTISHKTPNPFTAPVNIPKSPTEETPNKLDQDRMYSSSPFSTTPQPTSQNRPTVSPPQSHLHNVVTGQYNAPPTPPSTARSGSIDDKLELPSANTSYPQDQLKHPQPQQSYQPYTDVQSDAMIGSSSGLLTPVQSASDRTVPSRLPSLQHPTNTIRATKGKYSIVDFSIQRTLGTGSFGRVHLVQSRHNSRFYAIKVSIPSSLV
jgi:protein kinase A